MVALAVAVGSRDLSGMAIGKEPIEAARGHVGSTGAPPATKSAPRRTPTRGEAGSTGMTIGDARTIDDTVGDKVTIAGRSVAGDIPADGGQREHALAVATPSVDTLALGIAIIAVAKIVELGSVAACGTILRREGLTTTLLAFALGTFVGGGRAALGVARRFDQGAISGGQELEIGAVMTFTEVVHQALTIEAGETLAFRQARGNSRIASDRTSASGTVGDRHSDVGVAGTSLADILRATETIAVDLAILRRVAKTAGIGVLLGALP